MTLLDKLEALQKRCIKWIMKEEFQSYPPHIYYTRCKELDILPLKQRFILKDLKLFHSIINSTSSIILPEYMHFHEGTSRLRSSHLDNLSIISDIQPRITVNYGTQNDNLNSSSLYQFSNSYFYRTMNSWNSLSKDKRSILSSKQFESAVISHLWEVCRPSD